VRESTSIEDAGLQYLQRAGCRTAAEIVCMDLVERTLSGSFGQPIKSWRPVA
jgi:hypothetical protein